MIAGLVVVLVVAIIYAQSLGGPFLWDDQFLIRGVKLVEKGGTLDDYLKAPFWAGVNPEATLRTYYRPLVTASFALDHAIHGDNAAGYHLTNLLLHSVNALLVFLLVKRAGVRPAVAALLACCWAMLPRLAEAVAWISGRTDVLAGTFALAALLAWAPGVPRRILASGLLMLGVFSKESAAAAAVAIAVDEWWQRRDVPAAARLSRTALAMLPVVCVLGFYVVLRFRAVGFELSERELGVGGRLIVVLQSVGTYAAMLIDPLRPRAIIGTTGARSVSAVVAGVVVIAGALAVVFRHRKNVSRTTLVGLTLALAAIVPVLHVVPIPIRTLAADRFLYLPTAGLTLAFAPLVDRALARRRPAWIAATVAAAVLFTASIRRVGVWSDEITFWIDTYLETPRDNSSGAANLASLYYRVGMYEDALAMYRRAVSYDDRNRRTSRYNVALSLSRLGRNEEARQALLAGVSGGRPDSERQFHLALVELRLQKWDEAVPRLEDSARAGHPGARWLLPRLNEIGKRQRELADAGTKATHAEQARLAGLLGADSVAVAHWVHAIADARETKQTAMEGLIALVQSGGPDVLRAAVRTYTQRFGAIDRSTMASIEVRLADLDRLVGARPLVGLSR